MEPGRSNPFPLSAGRSIASPSLVREFLWSIYESAKRENTKTIAGKSGWDHTRFSSAVPTVTKSTTSM